MCTGLTLLSVEEVPIKKLNGAFYEKMQLLMHRIDTVLAIRVRPDQGMCFSLQYHS